MKFLENFQFPITDHVLVFLMVFVIIFIGPRVLRRIRIPGIIGFILAGMALGPKGFDIISSNTGIEMFAKFGLLYIMFLVGLEIDLVDFKKNQSKSVVFGVLTFFIPLVLGFFVTYYILKLNILASLLLSSMFSTHTLVSYPIASRLGITKNRVMNLIFGGTVITDTAVLILLAVIVKLHEGNMDMFFWLFLISSLALFLFVTLWLLPISSRWFFKHLEGDGSAQYLYLLTALFASAFLAELSGIEPMIGAFMAGLALNSLIPKNSVLMNRTVFIGNTIFIPFFLIGVGMVVDLRVLFNGYNSLIIAGVLVVTAELTKYIAAYITQKIYGYTVAERNVIFGLSSSHAAATIALIMVGYNIGLLNIDMLNGTIIVILISCLISSFVTENAGRRVAVADAKKKPEEISSRQKILVPVSNLDTMEQLISFALLIRNEKSKEPIHPLNVITENIDSEESRHEILKRSNLIEQVANQTVTDDNAFRMVTRLDLNVANGINRAIKELMITDVVLGWNGQVTTAQSFFGGILDNILLKNNQMIYVVKLLNPLGFFNRLAVFVPENAQFEPGFKKWVYKINDIAKEISARILFFSNKETQAVLKADFDNRSGLATFVEFSDYENIVNIKDHLNSTDLMIWINARDSTVSYMTYMASLPKQLSKGFKKSSFLIIYPEQHQVAHQNTNLRLDGLTKSPISENIERIKKIRKNVKKAITGKSNT